MKAAFSLFALYISLLGCAHPPKAEPPPPEKAIDQKWLQDVAGEHNHDVLYCYQTRLKVKPDLKGELQLSFSVTVDGDIADLEVKKSVDSEVDACVLAQAKTWKFPWNKRGSKGSLPMNDHFRLFRENEQPRSEFSEDVQGMDKEAIRKAIREHIADVRGCFEARLQALPDLGGKLVLEWDIESEGDVNNAKVKIPLEKGVDDCILEKLKTWKFAKPPNGMVGRVSYPFVFTSKK